MLQGRATPFTGQYVFEVSGEHNPQARYNTLDGKDAGENEQNHLVLDSSSSDGTTVHFDQLTSANFCDYNEDTGIVSLKEATTKICSLPAAAKGASRSTPVRVDVYVWLEGCDPDCTNNLAATSLQSLALRFAGKRS